ncbi:MAG TPA: CheR family methyltransferase [Chloroflexia bacterium]|nr:CheR family methyltransferase [Chloroflexia bacterium]
MEKMPLSGELFARVSTLLGDTAGLLFDESKLPTLQAHLHDRARAQRCTSLEQYVNLLADGKHGEEELRKLIEAVTIHETSFFRNHEHFRALREAVLPHLARRRAAERRLRIWSAGCATGEEPYSLAITCLEQPQLAGWDIQIFATDISERILALAKRGLYRGGALRYLEPERVGRWFKPHTDEVHPPAGKRGTGPLDPLIGQREIYAVGEKVRAMVHFGVLNLVSTPYPDALQDLDLIVCENVIIYFRPEVTSRVIAEFYNRLSPAGYLFLGYSETLWQISDRFALVTHPNTFFYQRPATEPEPVPSRPTVHPPLNLEALLYKLSQTSLAAERSRNGETAKAAAAAREASPTRPATAQPTSESVPAAVVPADPALDIAVAEQLNQQAHKNLEAGRYLEAQALFADALGRNSSSVDALVGLAQIHANQGRLAEACVECQKALDIDSLCEEAHLLSALIARQEGRTAEAIDHFEKLIYINGESIAGHFHLAEIYRAAGRLPAAGRHYRRALTALDRHPVDGTISGLPPGMVRRACEQQLSRITA